MAEITQGLPPSSLDPIGVSSTASSTAATQGNSLVVAFDPNTSTELPINSYLGTDAFYNQGIYGQYSVSANIEAGLVWGGPSGHETLTAMNSADPNTMYVGTGATGAYDWHATAVGMIIGGLKIDNVGTPDTPQNVIYYEKFGIAPLTYLGSGAIATSWDPAGPAMFGSFNITPKSFYSTYSHFFTYNLPHEVTQGGFTFSVGNAPADVINSSWGYTDPTGTDSYTLALDGMARAHPQTTVVLAAGNAGNATNTVGGMASGYNSISVGAVGGDTLAGFHTISDFSSRGPQDYYDTVHGTVTGVRAPVDVVAPGALLRSAAYLGQTGSNDLSINGTVDFSSSYPPTSNNLYWVKLDGTSFAAPLVTGAVSLLTSASYLNGFDSRSRDARVVKAVIMNSANKLPGWDNGQHLTLTLSGNRVLATPAVETTQSLDWQQGTGLLDMSRAYDQYVAGTTGIYAASGSTHDVQNTGWDLGSLTYDALNPAHNDYILVAALGVGKTLDVTLTWFRNRGDPTLDASTADGELVTSDLGMANLDLAIYEILGGLPVLKAISDSTYNNSEHLHYTIDNNGSYSVSVIYNGQVFGQPDTSGNESYGLAWAVVPEPRALALLAFGVMAVLNLGQRRRRCSNVMIVPEGSGKRLWAGAWWRPKSTVDLGLRRE